MKVMRVVIAQNSTIISRKNKMINIGHAVFYYFTLFIFPCINFDDSASFFGVYGKLFRHYFFKLNFTRPLRFHLIILTATKKNRNLILSALDDFYLFLSVGHPVHQKRQSLACRTKSRIKMRLLLILLEVLFRARLRARWRTDSNLELLDRLATP